MAKEWKDIDNVWCGWKLVGWSLEREGPTSVVQRNDLKEAERLSDPWATSAD